MKPLDCHQHIMLGCDPEFFFGGRNGSTMGSEKILPEKGIECGFARGSKIVIDGVQAELNPEPNNCRALLANEMADCFRQLRKTVNEKNKNSRRNISVKFSQVVKVTQKEMDELSEKSRIFGCAPSKNFYEKKPSEIKVDPSKYLKRSAGGHIHLGATSDSIRKALKNLDLMIPILDIIVGNTCVLLDRNPVNKERRKVYGKVGEFRVKSYGLEYRTLSNFWLQSYQLMSFVMGLSRMAVHIVEQSNKEHDYAGMLLAAVNREDIINAINNNNFALAYSNFLKIEKLIIEYAGYDRYYYPLNTSNIDKFHWMVKRGINYWFVENPLNHWCKIYETHNRGWESFLDNKVSKDLRNSEKTSARLVKKFIENLSQIRNTKINSLNDLRNHLSLLKSFEPEYKKSVRKFEVKKLEAIG